jgi:antitoxin ParD1/3/4
VNSVTNEALTLRDPERRAAWAALQSAISEGSDSGAPQPLDLAAFKRCMREKHAPR